MARTRAQAQVLRNKAVARQLQIASTKGAGSTEHLAAMETTREYGRQMEAAVAGGDRSGTDQAAAHEAQRGLLEGKGVKSSILTKHFAPTSGGGGGGGGGGGSGSVMSIPSGSFVRTRMGYDPSTMVDYTSTNPAYWNSVVSYFKGKPGGNPATGELGIWTPNFEKQGAESTALAAIAGGVTAHVNSNYSNNTVDDATAIGLGHASIDEHGRASTYRGGAEKAIRLNSISRGGTDVDTGRPMGGTDPIGYGAHIKGGVVTKGAMSGYLKDGGDYGGLLGKGTSITGDMLTRLLGGMDKDGMRLRGTMPSVMGATGSGVGAGGTKTSVGGLYAGGVDPLAKMPGVSDYTPYMDPNSVFGGRSGNAAVRSGLLYQPMASDYGTKMAGAGMPVFSPTGGLISSPGGMGGVRIGGVGAPTYGASPSGFSPAAIAAAGGGTATVGSSAGLRDGMTAGPHSAHLGAYAVGDGTWVWGAVPSGGEEGEGALPSWGEPMGTSLPGHIASSVSAMIGLLGSTEESRAAAAAAAGTGESAGEMGAGGMAGGGMGGGIR